MGFSKATREELQRMGKLPPDEKPKKQEAKKSSSAQTPKLDRAAYAVLGEGLEWLEYAQDEETPWEEAEEAEEQGLLRMFDAYRLDQSLGPAIVQSMTELGMEPEEIAEKFQAVQAAMEQTDQEMAQVAEVAHYDRRTKQLEGLVEDLSRQAQRSGPAAQEILNAALDDPDTVALLLAAENDEDAASILRAALAGGREVDDVDKVNAKRRAFAKELLKYQSDPQTGRPYHFESKEELETHLDYSPLLAEPDVPAAMAEAAYGPEVKKILREADKERLERDMREVDGRAAHEHLAKLSPQAFDRDKKPPPPKTDGSEDRLQRWAGDVEEVQG
jgi:hypothetical protein